MELRMPDDLKILFAGSMGAGKTTAIKAISDIDPVLTEQLNGEKDLVDKETTTVALDYGEVDLGDDQRLLLFGTPGQRRFDFMWETLGDGAIGLVILLNDEGTDGVAELGYFLTTFEVLLDRIPTVVGVTRLKDSGSLSDYQDALQNHERCVPVLPVDARSKQDVLILLECLLTEIEAASFMASETPTQQELQ